MATHGKRQLLRLTLSYCPYGGSSNGIKTVIKDYLRPIALANPDLEIAVETRGGRHPFVRGEYLTGWDKTIGVKNEDPAKIVDKITMLNESSGRKLTKFTKPVYEKRMSVQGRWTPGLDIKDDVFEVKEVLH
mmetsp:Transcript_18320/g.38118  ORF Transcript_18320/g.38118 Transcript_18320/m.38118 type:complete len:132 (+) Transcript_18320:213-608(+)